MSSPPVIKIIRAKTVVEIDGVAQIVAAAISTDFPYQSQTIKQYRDRVFNQKYFRKSLTQKNHFTFLAAEQGEIVGLISFSAEFGGVIFVEWLVVKKPYRKKGIGSQLLAKVESWAMAHHYHFLYLFTETQSNLGYYQSRGFKHVGVMENSWFGENEHLMSKSLVNQPFAKIFAEND